MKILSLDQSSRITGWAFFENKQLSKHGKFELTHPDFGLRLKQIREKINSLIDIYQPDKVVFEDIQLQENVQTFKQLAQVYGVILELLTELNMPYEIVLASSWKSTLGIKGKDRTTQKRNAQQYIINNYNIKPTQDECDAVCIGLHSIANENPNDWTK